MRWGRPGPGRLRGKRFMKGSGEAGGHRASTGRASARGAARGLPAAPTPPHTGGHGGCHGSGASGGQAAASAADSGSRSLGKLPDVRANSLIKHFLSILFFLNLDLLHGMHQGGGSCAVPTTMHRWLNSSVFLQHLHFETVE